MSTQIQILIQFRSQLITFIDELISQFPDETDLIILRIFLKDQVPVKDIMETFCESLLKCRGQIEARDENYFVHSDFIFARIKSKEKVSHFRKLWRSGQLDDEDKMVIWKWIESFVSLADKYSSTKLP